MTLTLVSFAICLIASVLGAFFFLRKSTDSKEDEAKTSKIPILIGLAALFTITAYFVAPLLEDNTTPYVLSVQVPPDFPGKDPALAIFDMPTVYANSKEAGIDEHDEAIFKFDPSEMPPDKKVLVVAKTPSGERAEAVVDFSDGRNKSVSLYLQKKLNRPLPKR